jgi:hypothetical protein
MKPTGRLQIYPPSGPRKSGYVVADRAALRGLAEAIKSAATSTFGFETVKLYSADGHEYELVITSSVTEDEWQTIQPNYTTASVPKVETLQNYQDLKDQLTGS